MAKARRSSKRSTRGRARTFEAIPLTGYTPAEGRLALKFDTLVTSATVKDRQIKAMQPEIIGAKVRGGSATIGKTFIDFTQVAGFTWPDALYIPRDQQASSRPKPPDSRLYSQTGPAAPASRRPAGIPAACSPTLRPQRTIRPSSPTPPSASRMRRPPS